MPGICGVAWIGRERGARCAAEMGRRLAAARATRVSLATGRGAALAQCAVAGAAWSGEPAVDPARRLLCAVDGAFFDDAHDPAKSAAESLLDAYRSRGDSALRGLRGQYSAAVWDGDARTLYLVSDKLGTHNLYWTLYAGDFIFTSELRSLIAVPGLRLRADDEGLVEYLAFGFPLHDRTILEGVRLLLPGSILTLCGGGVRIERYWQADMGEGRPERSLGECVAELDARLTRAVERRTARLRRVGLGLSGGRDSRLLAGYLAEGSAACTAYAFNEDEPLAEGRVARLVAESLGIGFHHVTLPTEDLADRMREYAWQSDGFINTCEYRAVAETAAAGEEAIAWGFGGDVLSGVPLHPVLYGAKDRDRLCRLQLALEGGEMIPLAEHAAALHPDFHARCRGVVEENYRRCFRELECEEIPNLWMLFELRQRQRRRTLRVMSISDAWLPALYPYADDDVLEFLLAQPVRWKRYRKTYGELLNRRFPRLADVVRPYHRLSMRWETRLFPLIAWAKRLQHGLDGPGRAGGGLLRGVDRLYAEALCGPLRETAARLLLQLARERKLLSEPYARELLEPARISRGGHFRVLKLLTLSAFLAQLFDGQAPAVADNVAVVEKVGTGRPPRRAAKE